MLLDPEGREIADPLRIPQLALRDARSILAQEALDGRIDLRCFIQVRDEGGAVVHELRFPDALVISGLALQKSAVQDPGIEFSPST